MNGCDKHEYYATRGCPWCEIEELQARLNVRPEVEWFARQMEKKLKENDHKPHWSGMPMECLVERLRQETEELVEAIVRRDDDEIKKEAADVANFAMMIADNAN